jgi:hypothetical protein
VSVTASGCTFHLFVGPWSHFTDCDKVKDLLTKAGVSFTSHEAPAASAEQIVTTIGTVELKGFDAKAYGDALTAAGFPSHADPKQVRWVMAELLLIIMVLYVTMVYGPIAAFLVELFPARIRYTSLSLPYHIGNGWFGGMLPLLATAVVAATGNIYNGLWYPIGVALITLVVGSVFLREARGARVRLDL